MNDVLTILYFNYYLTIPSLIMFAHSQALFRLHFIYSKHRLYLIMNLSLSYQFQNP